MRRALILVGLLAACKGDPLHDDMKVFCRAADVKHSAALTEIGPYVAERVKSKEMLDILVKLKGGEVTLDDVAAQFRALQNKAGLDDCATLDILEGKAKMVPAPQPAQQP